MAESVLRDIAEKITSLKCTGNRCIIGIGGGAGVGKTTLAQSLKRMLESNGKDVYVLSLDDFIRSPEDRARLKTEWDEKHINLFEAERVLKEIKIGKKKIEKPEYVRKTKIINIENVDLSGKDIVIFEGIYAIASDRNLGNFFEFLDLAIFLSAELSDMKAWRFMQESQKPHPRNSEKMELHWNLGILPDFRKNILPSKKNAHFVIHIDSNHNLMHI